MLLTLAERVKTQLPGVTTSVDPDLGNIFVYLSEEQNISKDWMLFMEANEEFIQTIGKAKEYKVKHDQSYGSYDYKYPELDIFVNYNGGKCKRVKIGTKTKTVTEDVYEVQCL